MVQAPQVNLIIASIALAIVLRSVIMLAWGPDARRVPVPRRQSDHGGGAPHHPAAGVRRDRRRGGSGRGGACPAADAARTGAPRQREQPGGGWPHGDSPDGGAGALLGLSAGLGALGGILVAPIVGNQVGMGQAILVKAFAAAILGGLAEHPRRYRGRPRRRLAENLASACRVLRVQGRGRLRGAHPRARGAAVGDPRRPRRGEGVTPDSSPCRGGGGGNRPLDHSRGGVATGLPAPARGPPRHLDHRGPQRDRHRGVWRTGLGWTGGVHGGGRLQHGAPRRHRLLALGPQHRGRRGGVARRGRPRGRARPAAARARPS